MPKEITYGTTENETFSVDGVVRENCARGVQVGWNRDGWVQIGTLLRYGIESTKDEPAHLRYSTERGWYVDLGRTQINDLIRNLRRARDQAYGRDE